MTQRKCFSRWGGVIVAVGLGLAAMGCGKMGPSQTGGAAEHSLVGAPAPPFDLPGYSGGAKKVALSDGAGKVMLVDFWATWCEPCKDSFPHHQALAEKYAGQVVVVGISIDDEPGGIADFAKKNGAKFAIGWDEGQSVSGTYSPPTMPTAYIIDKSGIVRYVHAGFRKGDEAEIDAHIAELLK
ncbi:MAG: TlpA family protein disulfide reductase [Myxococcales bacterium]|nr:TlpA family protein disulfide reductase [Myxococcales bacterium]